MAPEYIKLSGNSFNLDPSLSGLGGWVQASPRILEPFSCLQRIIQDSKPHSVTRGQEGCGGARLPHRVAGAGDVETLSLSRAPPLNPRRHHSEIF